MPCWSGLIRVGLCLWLPVVLTLQGEALINDKINWLALIFAIYSVSFVAPQAVAGGGLISGSSSLCCGEGADSLGMVVGWTCQHKLRACGVGDALLKHARLVASMLQVSIQAGMYR